MLPPMATIVITGANRGIGLRLATLLLQRGDDVIALCRKKSPALEALGVRVEEGIDVSSDDVIAVLGERLAGVGVDVLINNAGILTSEALDDLDMERIRRQFEVNSLGPLRVTKALLPNLSEGSKIAIVTSRMGSLADNTSGSRYGYRMSKAAVNMAGVSLANDLKDRGIAVIILHPGFVRTDMTGNNGMVEPEESAAGLVARIDELSLETSGSFRHANGEALPW
jgi:NAD(P)-dependent dehydrogenase (short-subunit alcohol dehydrogenase family)